MIAAGHANTGDSRLVTAEIAGKDSGDEVFEQDAVSTISLSDRLLMGGILVVVSLICVYAFTRIVPILIAHGY